MLPSQEQGITNEAANIGSKTRHIMESVSKLYRHRVAELLVLGRAFYIQRFQGNYWRSMSDSLHQRIVPLDAERGTIYSEDGQMLSTSLPTFDIYMDFKADGLREKNGKRFKENIDSFAVAYRGTSAINHPGNIKKNYRLLIKQMNAIT